MRSAFSIFLGLYSTLSVYAQPKETRELFQRADSVFDLSNYEDAMQYYQRIFHLSLQENDQQHAVRAKLQEAACHLKLGEVSKAQEVNETASEMMQSKAQLREAFHHQFLLNAGSIAYSKGDFNSAIPQLKSALNWSKKHQLKSGEWEVGASEMLAYSFYFLSRLDSAITWAERFYRAKKTASKGQDTLSKDLIAIRTGIGHLHLERGNYYLASENFEKAAKLQDALPDCVIVSSTPLVSYGNSLALTGAVYDGLEKINQGIHYLSEQGILYNQYNIISIAILAETLMKGELFSEADSVIDVYLDSIADHQDYFLQSTGLFIKGMVLYHQSKWEESFTYLQACNDRLITSYPNSAMIPLSFHRMIEIQFALGEEAYAKDLLQQARSFIRHQYGDTNANWFALQTLVAKNLIERNQLDSAESILHGILQSNKLKLSKESYVLSDPWSQILSLKNLAYIAERRGKDEDIANGMRFLLRADSVVDKMRFSFYQFRDRMNLSDSINNFYDYAISYCANNYPMHDQKENANLIYFFQERSKAVNLSQHLLAKTENAKSLRSQVNEIWDYEKDLGYYVSRINQWKEDSSYKGFTSKALQLETKIDSTRTLVQKKSIPGVSRYHAPRAIGEVKEKMNPRTAIVSYTVSRESIGATIIERDTIRFQNLGDSDSLHAMVRTFITFINNHTRQNVNAYKDVAYALFELLLAPVLDDDIDRIIVIPDEILYLIPFEALVYDEAGESFGSLSYLLHRYEIQYGQSTTLLSYLQDKPSTSNNKVLALAPAFARQKNLKVDVELTRAGLSPLPYSMSEVNAISQHFDTKELTGEEATEQSVRTFASNYGIVHLATHSLINDEEPLNSKVLLNKDAFTPNTDGLLHGHEIIGLKLNAEMIVLSSCNTGVGSINKGEGTQSIASYFFYAGANAVVMSLWPANDLSSSKIMTNFYQYLGQGLTKSASLKRAQLDYLSRTNEATSHPYYWAQFVLYGKNDPINQTSSSFDRWKWGVMTMALIVLIFFIRKRIKTIH